jgi:exopolysaccharide biosynthesis polyprenyl glycosylphosphotransferase
LNSADAPQKQRSDIHPTVETSESQEIRRGSDAAVLAPDSRERVRTSRFRQSVPLLPTTGPIHEGRLSRRILRRDAFYRRYLAFSDLLVTYAAVLIATGLAGGAVSSLALVGAPIVVLLAKMFGLYDRDELLVHKTTLDEAPALFQLATVFTLAAWIVQDSLAPQAFTTAEKAVLWPLLAVGLVLGRASVRRVARRMTTPERCVVIGHAAAADALKLGFARGAAVSADIIGRIPIQYGQREGEDPPGVIVPSSVALLGDLGDLREIVEKHQIDRVLVIPNPGATEALLDVVRAVKAFGARVSVVPRLFEVVGSSAAFDEVQGTTLLGLRRYGLSRSSWRLKRSFDFTVAAGLLVLLSPLFALIALAIKLDSGGPVLFRQRRIGHDELEFEMVKFRTMTEDAELRKDALAPLNEADGLFKISDDPRITRVGRFLRKTSLDELPQLLNVVRGEMSLVGPRPLVPDDDELVQGWHRRRLHVPPGMTGHWQILGSSRVPLGEMVKIDYLYGANWSLWGDLKILLRTVPYVLARRGQ